MRIRSLDTGLEIVTRWQTHDEVHLPQDKALRPGFLPDPRPLAVVLDKPSLDERLPGLLEPRILDPEMLSPVVLAELRNQTRRFFSERARSETGARAELLSRAARQLDEDAVLDDEVRAALSLLLKG